MLGAAWVSLGLFGLGCLELHVAICCCLGSLELATWGWLGLPNRGWRLSGAALSYLGLLGAIRGCLEMFWYYPGWADTENARCENHKNYNSEICGNARHENHKTII